MIGKIHSIETLGAADGPGVRFTVFMQGCNLRCACCHNPDTWDFAGGVEASAEELVRKAARYKEYFGAKGGVTVSGGEPLLQSEFVTEFFKECHKNGINTCLDTSGCVLNDSVKALLDVTDLVLLDIKYTTAEDYRLHVGCEMVKPLEFLEYLENIGKPYWVRQVIIPGLNDDDQNIERLNDILRGRVNCQQVELLPFKKFCTTKYDSLGIEFPLANTPEPTNEKIQYLSNKIDIR